MHIAVRCAMEAGRKKPSSQSPWYNNFDSNRCVDPELWGFRVKVEARCGVEGIFHAFVQATKLDANHHQLPRRHDLVGFGIRTERSKISGPAMRGNSLSMVRYVVFELEVLVRRRWSEVCSPSRY